jgi:hypothetical protein
VVFDEAMAPEVAKSPPLTSPLSSMVVGSGSDADQGEKEARLRSKTIAEIVESEEKYVTDLKAFIDLYLVPLRTGGHAFTLFDRRDVQVVFSTIELIYQGNSGLLAELQSKMRLIPETAIGTTFMNIDDRLQYYSVYCNHQEEARAAIEQLIQTNPQLKAFLDSTREAAKGLSFIDFFVKPFQRLLKYPLLLKEVLKHTAPDHADYENLKRAYGTLQSVVDKINYTRAHAENMRRLVAISESISGLKEFADPTR